MSVEIANRLAEFRLRAGLSQEELAQRVNVSPWTIDEWERGVSSPNADQLLLLARVYGVSLDELLGSNKANNDFQQNSNGTYDQTFIPSEEEIVQEVVDNPRQVREDAFTKQLKVEKISWIVSGLAVPVGVLAFLIVGFTWTYDNYGWKFGWTLILDAIWLSSIVPVVIHKRLTDFAYPIFAIALYCTLGILGGFYGFPGWSVYWFLFLTIPMYYIIAVRIQYLWLIKKFK